MEQGELQLAYQASGMCPPDSLCAEKEYSTLAFCPLGDDRLRIDS